MAHVIEVEARKAAETEAARAKATTKKPFEPLSVNYFNKLGKANLVARAGAKADFADDAMPDAVRHFTCAVGDDAPAGAADAGVPVATRPQRRQRQEGPQRHWPRALWRLSQRG